MVGNLHVDLWAVTQVMTNKTYTRTGSNSLHTVDKMQNTVVMTEVRRQYMYITTTDARRVD